MNSEEAAALELQRLQADVARSRQLENEVRNPLLAEPTELPVLVEQVEHHYV